jgi:hypothetical protein
MGRVIVLAVAIALAGFVSGGIYTASSNGASGGVTIMNRFTGTVWSCFGSCEPVQYKNSNSN